MCIFDLLTSELRGIISVMYLWFDSWFCHPGDRTNVASTDLSDILPEEVEAEVKLAAEISMGTEVSEQDICNIVHLCDQVCAFRSKVSALS